MCISGCEDLEQTAVWAKCFCSQFSSIAETVAAGAADILPLYLRQGDDCKMQHTDQFHLTFHAYTVDTTPKLPAFRHLTLALTLLSQATSKKIITVKT